MFDGQKAYRIPDDKRELYFEFVDKFKNGRRNIIGNESVWHTYSDPIVIIDFSVLHQFDVIAVKLAMSRIGAKDVSDAFID